MNNISLETSVHWLSKELGSRMKVGFTRNLQKCNSYFTFLTFASSSHRPNSSKWHVCMELIFLDRRRHDVILSLLTQRQWKRKNPKWSSWDWNVRGSKWPYTS